METISSLEAQGDDPVSYAEQGSKPHIAKHAVLKDGSQGGNEGDEEEEEEEEEECGFCLYMKSGPCKESFIAWEECVEQAEKLKEDIVAKCHKVTLVLKECMEENADYYGPVLKAEREIDDQAALQEQREDASASEKGNFTGKSENQSQEGALDELRKGAGGSEEGKVGGKIEKQSQEGCQVGFQTAGDEGLKQAALHEHMEGARGSEEELELEQHLQEVDQVGPIQEDKKV